jgi:hypothetical protein
MTKLKLWSSKKLTAENKSTPNRGLCLHNTDQDLEDTVKAFEQLVEAIHDKLPFQPQCTERGLLEVVTGGNPDILSTSSFAHRPTTQCPRPNFVYIAPGLSIAHHQPFSRLTSSSDFCSFQAHSLPTRKPNADPGMSKCVSRHSHMTWISSLPTQPVPCLTETNPHRTILSRIASDLFFHSPLVPTLLREPAMARSLVSMYEGQEMMPLLRMSQRAQSYTS